MPEFANTWKRISYTLASPIYNMIAGPLLAPMRRLSITVLGPRRGERVLLMGAGTGLDLDYLPRGLNVTAIDLTPAMLVRLQARATRLDMTVDARVMDGHALQLPDASFDAVVLHFIIGVIPDPIRCIREVARVLRPGGRAVILDKFLPGGAPAPLLLRLLDPVMNIIGTRVTRTLEPIVRESTLTQVRNDAAGFRGFCRVVLLAKPGGGSAP